METKINEIPVGTFFIHQKQIKYKIWQSKKGTEWIKHHAITITMDLKNNLRWELNNYPNSAKEIEGDEQVTLLNIQNWELDLFQENFSWFLFDPQQFEILNFSSINFEEKTALIEKMKLDFSRKENHIYKGKVYLSINNGKLDLSSIIFKEVFDEQSEIEKINFLLFKELNYEKNVEERRKNIFNTIFTNNQLFSYIKDIKKELNQNEDIDFDLWKSLNILIFCLIESDFYSALITIRMIRNLIMSFIYEKIFIPKYSKMKKIINEIDFIDNMLKIGEEEKVWITAEQSKEYYKYRKIKIEKLMELDKWNKKYDLYFDSKNRNETIEELDFYYSIPIYTSSEHFESIDSNLKNEKIISNKKIISYIKQEILKNENEKLNWKRANYWTNNSIHKNNYDTQRFKNWYLNKNELDILTKTLSIYFDVFKIVKTKYSKR